MTDTTNQTNPADPTPTPRGEATATKPSRRRTVLITGGAVLAAAVLIGGGVAVGAAMADENDDERDTISDPTQSDDNDANDDSDASDAASVAGTASVEELLDIIETASAEAEGEPVEIEAGDAGSWDVLFATTAGDESEVRVQADGSAVVVGTEVADQDDRARESSLDSTTVESLVTAVLGDTDGTVIDIEIDSDTVSPYDVTVLTADRKTVDIALDSDFTVLTADSDND
jgi:hypothetical protein